MLADEPCPDCTPQTPKLEPSEQVALLAQLDPAWSIDGDHLVRTWRFPDFASALAFVNRVGAVAEDAGHHPDVWLTWGRVRLQLSTHAVGGLTRADFVLAARIDRLI